MVTAHPHRELVLESLTAGVFSRNQLIEILLMVIDDWEISAAITRSTSIVRGKPGIKRISNCVSCPFSKLVPNSDSTYRTTCEAIGKPTTDTNDISNPAPIPDWCPLRATKLISVTK
jgi:hypothetical protein